MRRLTKAAEIPADPGNVSRSSADISEIRHVITAHGRYLACNRREFAWT